MSWEGYGVSVRCGALGCYQGTIVAADGESITLTKPFRNGFPYPKAQVTLKASDIKSLEIISERVETAPAHSTVVAGGRRRGARAPVGESLQPPQPAPAPPQPLPQPPQLQNNNNASGAGGGNKARSKPIDIQGARPARQHTHSGSYGAGGGGGGGVAGSAARRRNEACFGAGALDRCDQDFDFEGNLALFDKEALRQQMRPDVVRVAAAREEAAANLRPDQSVLPAAPPAPDPVHVPLELRGPVWYVTDGGVLVPSLSARARRAAWRALRAADTGGAARVLLARAAADVALRLVGGGRRLEPRNAHQRPTAAVAVGVGPAAAAGVETARLLQSHGVDTYVIAPSAPCSRLAAALEAYAAGEGRVLRAADAAERARADLLLLALHDPEDGDDLDAYGSELIEWALSMRSTLLLLEPGGGGALWARAGEAARASVVALLPGAGGAGGRLLLANVAPPAPALAALGLRYRPPFGAAALLPLHPRD